MTRLLFVSTILAALAAPAAAQTGHDGHGDHGGGPAAHGSGPAASSSPTMSAASQAYMDAMKAMDRDMAAMPMTGQAGVDFAAMMIPHHQAAIDMAEAYLASADKDPELTALSREIIAAQEREIAFLKVWLAKQPR